MIFCKTYNNIIANQYFKQGLGQYFTEPPGSANFVVNRVVNVYSHCTHETVKNKIISEIIISRLTGMHFYTMWMQVLRHLPAFFCDCGQCDAHL